VFIAAVLSVVIAFAVYVDNSDEQIQINNNDASPTTYSMTAKAGKNLSHPKKQQQYHLQIRQRIHAKAVSFSSQPQQQHHQPIAHQCDGCNLFPITNLARNELFLLLLNFCFRFCGCCVAGIILSRITDTFWNIFFFSFSPSLHFSVTHSKAKTLISAKNVLSDPVWSCAGVARENEYIANAECAIPDASND